MSTATTPSRLVPELRAICGAEHVVESVGESDQTQGAGNAPLSVNEFLRAQQGPSQVVVVPASADEVAAILRLANEQGFSVVPRGGMSSVPAQGDVVLDTTRLTEVEHYDPADLTVGVGAGMTVMQLSAMVGANQLLFAVDPPCPERATIGGVLATASHGPMRHGYGGVRDFCIGVRFVTGDGRKAKGGGRVVKNVAGYDMMKLLIGSYGTLAIITSASFKLFPAPRQTRTFLAEFATWMEALKFRDMVLCSPLSPMCLELVSSNGFRLMGFHAVAESWNMYVRASGSDAVLARYRQELGSAVTREVEGEEKELWRNIENCEDACRVDVTVPPGGVAEVLASLEELLKQSLFKAAILGRVGIGHVAVFTELPKFGNPDRASEIITHLRDQVRHEIHFSKNSRMISTASWEVPSGQKPSMLAVKQTLDPRDILNRGRFPL